MVIAIDGPSGVGKSTVSRAVAAALGISYLDTGSYYRAATHVALLAGIDPADEAGIVAALAAANLTVGDGVLLLDGAEIAAELRGGPVTASVSAVAAHPTVRSAVVAMQRDWIHDQGDRAVVEGRDIGTVVAPDAPVKVFLIADAATRAERRAGDDEASGANVKDLQADMMRRDVADSTRKASPLRPADDAITIDTSGLSIAQVVEAILELAGAVELDRH